MNSYKTYFKQWIKFLANPKWAFWVLLWMIVLVVVGTIAQKSLGLHMAQEKYFFSVFIWPLPFFPLPGGMLTMGILTICLLAEVINKLDFSPKKMGIQIVHLGAFLLLFSGPLSLFFKEEGFIEVYEGKSSQFLVNYHQLELAIIDGTNKNYDQVISIPESFLIQNKKINHPNLPAPIIVNQFFRNCQFKNQLGSTMTKLPLEKDYELNNGCLDISLNKKRFILSQRERPSKLLSIGQQNFLAILRLKMKPLPFRIKLHQFSKEFHPDTKKPKSFASKITLQHLTENYQLHKEISMNKPLRFEDYTIYQSSYRDEGSQQVSVFSVVKNKVRLSPYLSGGLIFLGLILHFFIMFYPRIVRRFTIALLLFGSTFGLFSHQSVAGEFSEIPILYQGRVMPLDTFSKVLLKKSYGKESYKKSSSISWLKQMIFTPQIGYEIDFIKIKKDKVREILNLPDNKTKTYSINELGTAIQKVIPLINKILQKKRDDQNSTERRLIELYNITSELYYLTRSLTLITETFQFKYTENAKSLSMETNKDYSYIDFYKKYQRFTKAINQVHERTLIEQSSADEELLMVGRKLEHLESDKNSTIFKVIPTIWNKKIPFISPWELTYLGEGSPLSSKVLSYWRELESYYKEKNEIDFKKTVSNLNKEIKAKVKKSWKLKLEKYYNQFDLLFWAFFCYLIALLILFIPKERRFFKFWNFLSLGWQMVGLTTHILDLILRLIISGRPPVTTLYESIIFVAFVVVISGVLMQKSQHKIVGKIVSLTGGPLLLFLSFGYAREGDTFGTLIAVLDTDFWLTVHVITITIGYGMTTVLGVIAHVYLIRKLVHKNFGDSIKKESKNLLRKMTIISLIFATIGTILGGFWADQSWGRFWGWDPKENGALLIILWLLLIIHGRQANIFSNLGLLFLTALSPIIVSLAWFGVNLLSIGLHSYGFTNNVAINLLTFIVIDLLTLFGAFLWIKINQRKK